MTLLAEAIQIAVRAHEDQYDKGGAPYVLHPLRVMLSVPRSTGLDTEVTRAVAVLHDVVEDTDFTLKDVLTMFGVDVADGVEACTRREGERYGDFIERANEHPTGRIVKILDILDNVSPERMAALDPGEAAGMTVRYTRALTFLLHLRPSWATAEGSIPGSPTLDVLRTAWWDEAHPR